MRKKNIRSSRSEYTGDQMKIAKIIEDIGFPCDLEKEFPPYQADMYISEFHVIIEFDGVNHGSTKAKDAKRDKYLWDNYLVPVKRFRYVPEQDEIIDFFDEWADSSKERRKNCNLGKIG